MTPKHFLYLVWVCFILSAGFACGIVAWRTFRLRKRHRVFHYFGMVKTALLLATLNSSYALYQLIRERGLVVFDNLTIAAYRSLLVQTILALTLWALALYLLGKINGVLGG